MKFFAELGDLIQQRWKRQDFDWNAFPDIATTALVELTPSAHISLPMVVDHVLNEDALGPQTDSTFGEPPMLLYQTEYFYIEALPWVDGTTAVHQHAFSGAFTVLKGSSIHTRFRFRQHKRWSENLIHGELDQIGLELLREGDVRPIHAGPELIHSVFHLDRPSATIVVRTRHESHVGPQLSYARRSGLAWCHFHKPKLLEVRLKLLKLMAETLPEDAFIERCHRMFADADAFATVRMCLTLAQLLSPEEFERIVLLLRPRHRELWTLLTSHLAEQRRESTLIALRRTVHDPEHRFFLALLLNVVGRERYLELVRDRYPEREPVQAIMSWVEALTKPEAPLLGVRLDASARRVFRAMLSGCDGDALIAELQRELPASAVDEHRAKIAKLSDALRRSAAFGALFAAVPDAPVATVVTPPVSRSEADTASLAMA